MTARDEGAGTMGRGEEALDQLRKAAIEALALYDVAVMAAQFTKPGRGQVIVNVERAEKVMAGLRAAIMGADPAAPVSAPGMDREEGIRGPHEPAALGLNGLSDGEEFLEFKEALSDLRSLRHEYECLNGGGPGWSARNEAAWARVNELFANEDEAAWVRQQEDAHG